MPEFPSIEHREFLEFFTEDQDRAAHLVYERQLCDECGGRGAHVLHGHAFTQDERDEMGDEWPDFVEDAAAGMYDTPCHTCDGNRVVDVPVGGEDFDHWQSWERDVYEADEIQRQERMMGA